MNKLPPSIKNKPLSILILAFSRAHIDIDALHSPHCIYRTCLRLIVVRASIEHTYALHLLIIIIVRHSFAPHRIQFARTRVAHRIAIVIHHSAAHHIFPAFSQTRRTLLGLRPPPMRGRL